MTGPLCRAMLGAGTSRKIGVKSCVAQVVASSQPHSPSPTPRLSLQVRLSMSPEGESSGPPRWLLGGWGPSQVCPPRRTPTAHGTVKAWMGQEASPSLGHPGYMGGHGQGTGGTSPSLSLCRSQGAPERGWFLLFAKACLLSLHVKAFQKQKLLLVPSDHPRPHQVSLKKVNILGTW